MHVQTNCFAIINLLFFAVLVAVAVAMLKLVKLVTLPLTLNFEQNVWKRVLFLGKTLLRGYYTWATCDLKSVALYM